MSFLAGVIVGIVVSAIAVIAWCALARGAIRDGVRAGGPD